MAASFIHLSNTEAWLQLWFSRCQSFHIDSPCLILPPLFCCGWTFLSNDSNYSVCTMNAAYLNTFNSLWKYSPLSCLFLILNLSLVPPTFPALPQAMVSITNTICLQKHLGSEGVPVSSSQQQIDRSYEKKHFKFCSCRLYFAQTIQGSIARQTVITHIGSQTAQRFVLIKK